MNPLPSISIAPRVHDLGKYRLIAELARGGMGIVYLALARGPGGFNKLLVLKELKPDLTDDESFVTMFLDEARLTARLSHPNIVQTFEVGSEGNRPFLAMEYLEGQSLSAVRMRMTRTRRPIALDAHLRVLAAVLGGLHYAHELEDYDGTPLGVVHRDVSPHNVFLTYDWQVKLLDFGIAKAVDASQETRSGVLKGKVSYMAPEQAVGEKVDRRADVFSVGVMLWEAAVGRRMWKKGMGDAAILTTLTTRGLPDPREANPEVPEALAKVCIKATARLADDRYATAAAMQADLEAYLTTLDPPTSARDCAHLMASLFDEERLKIKRIIEEQIRVVRSVSSGQFSAIEMARLEATGAHRVGTPSSSRPIPSSSAAVEVPTAQPASGTTAVSPGTTARAHRGGRIAFVLGAIAVVGAGAVLAISSRGGERDRTAAPQTSPVAAPTTSPASAAPSASAPQTDLSAASAEPSKSRPDGTPRAKPQVGSVPFPAPSPPMPKAPASAPATAPSEAAPTATASSRPKRNIDKNDPYGQGQ